MLYYLFDYLNDLNVPGAGMFTYISFRSLLAIIIALLVSTIFGKHFISMLKRQQITETQRDESIDPFGVQKKDTPTMGGIIILAAILIPCLLLGRLDNVYMILMLVAYMGFPILGDPQYGSEASKAYSDRLGLTYQRLCAASLEFPHPITGEPMILRSQMDAAL